MKRSCCIEKFLNLKKIDLRASKIGICSFFLLSGIAKILYRTLTSFFSEKNQILHFFYLFFSPFGSLQF